ncbi:MAG: DUF2188 domain-containing protein [Sphaerochaetaceae bacterium]|nr:DUF2188 domain-containing protein [Sphaerochaetaceae bacterium]
MAKQKTHHVVPNKDKGGWDVKKGGASRASVHVPQKKMLLIKLEILALIKIVNFIYMEKMERFKIKIRMEMIPFHLKVN